jgi:hypothetical protein
MPEPPDFEQIAKRVLLTVTDITDPHYCGSVTQIAEQLRQVWNARGAADIATIDADLPGASTKQLARVLHRLDR